MKNTGQLPAKPPMGLFIDMLCAFLLSAGSSAALVPLIVPDSGVWECVWLSAAALPVIVLLSRRWWIAPAAASAAGLAALLFLPREWEKWFDGLRSFLYWIMSDTPASDENAFLFSWVLRILAVLLISSSAFLLVRRLFFVLEALRIPDSIAALIAFLLLAGTCAGLLVFAALREPSDLSAAVCLCAAGLVIILPRIFACVIGRRGENAFSDARVRMQAVAIPAAFLAVCFALLVTPENTQAWKSRMLINLVTEISALTKGPFSQWPEVTADFSLSRLGFQGETGRLGGPVSLRDERYLTVWTAQPVLLKGRVLDYYTGSSWLIGAPDGDLRLSSLFWSGYKRTAFDMDKPIGTAEAKALYERLTTLTTVKIRYDKRIYNTIFSVGASPAVSFGGKWRSDAYFNMRSELYVHTLIPSRTEYTLKTRIWQNSQPEFDALFTELEALAADDEAFASIVGRYTQLPDTLPVAVRSLADDITGGIASPYGKAKALGLWLADNCRYTLTPEMPPENADFTAHFLETREGHCVYYATAMTVLARCAGLPARYIQGFALQRAPGAYELVHTYAATGLTAHAWCEVYFEGIGWVPFDPLAWNAEAPLNEPVPEQNPETVQPPAAPVREAYETPAPSAGYEHAAAPGLSGTPKYFLGAVAAFAILWFAGKAVMGRKFRCWSASKVQSRYRGAEARLDAVYCDALKLLALLGITPEPMETLQTFPARADRFLRLEGVTLSVVAHALSLSHFAHIAPADEDVDYACRYHQALERETLLRLGKTKYFLTRALTRL